MICTSHLYAKDDLFFAFLDDVAHLMGMLKDCRNEQQVYGIACALERSIIRQHVDKGLEYGIFEPLPGSFYVAVPVYFETNHQLFIQCFKRKYYEQKS